MSALTEEERKARHRETNRNYRAAHPEQVRERERRYYAAHPEKIREANRRYSAAHPEKIREKARRYLAAHPGYRKKYRAAHPEIYTEKGKELRKLDKEILEIDNLLSKEIDRREVESLIFDRNEKLAKRNKLKQEIAAKKKLGEVL
jgi:hypothetical protein